MKTHTFQHVAEQLVDIGKFFHQKSWVPATSGNFSARIDLEQIAITASGCHKGQLTVDDILITNLHGDVLNSTRKASAETLLHTTLYKADTNIGCVLHQHSVNATVLSLTSGNQLQLNEYEVLKAFVGIDTHETFVTVPIFKNDQNIDRLAKAVLTYRDVHPEMQGYLIAGHGLYTWGQSILDAQRHIEAFEFLFECELKMRSLAA
jgi:methylthioribulose-1-phosphate dehydratase